KYSKANNFDDNKLKEKNNGNSGNENRGIIDFREEEENHK
ncbi:19541_t:CDS:1, partial [Entrophospora sp. SA101]